MMWLVCNENVVNFLQGVPPHRQHRLSYEDMVTHPEAAMKGVADFLQIPYCEALIDPYSGGRMTELAGGRQAGDPMFYARKKIDSASAQSSLRRPDDVVLAQDTVTLANSFGYTDA
jgi:hypothetical protein